MRLADYVSAPPEKRMEEERRSAFDLEELEGRLRELLYAEVSSERIAQLLERGRTQARRELAATSEQIMRANGFPELDDTTRARLVAEVLDMVLGLGPLEPLLADSTVTEIMVNGPRSIFFERNGIVHKSSESFASEAQLRLVVDRIVSPLGRRVDEQCPYVNARLPEGHRVNVVIPPLSLVGTVVTIRKFRARAFTLPELVELGTLNDPLAQFLRWAVRARKNLAVSGGTGSGKTTLLNALSREIPFDERIITIEDSAELRFDQHPHVVRLEARLANAEGKGEVTIRELVVNSLRMRPDRIIVGECRGPEAADMLQAMTSGHEGSLTTLHANSPAEVVSRLVMMVRYGMDLPVEAIREQIASALDLVVQQDRMPGGRRRITRVVQRNLSWRAGQSPDEIFEPVVYWDRHDKRYVWQAVPSWIDELVWNGTATKEEVSSWLQEVHSS